ncbi:MAG TPA: methyltransferase domain-containing protein [bacterium]|nr:methyltransferase domain-containing protein [bacterium]
MIASPLDTSAFEAFEASGWERQAPGYDGFFTEITNRTADAVLDAAGVMQGTRLLDIATGPGLVAGRGAARGAAVVGIDIADAMVAIARRRCPQAEFRRADAHELPFADASFDAVTGNFAILHLGRPDQAVRECARVLAPGGTLALTVWDEPERTALFGALLGALDACGAAPPADIPAGPAFFRFSADNEFRALLAGSGLDHVTVETISFVHRVSTVDELWNGIIEGTVRTSALVSGQPPITQHRIRDAYADILEHYRQGDTLDLPTSVKLAAGTTPQTA